jgi:type II secretory pathway pseudopilin PulG
MKPALHPRRHARADTAFTLLEVMIALAIFFTATFAILSLMSSTLHNAKALQVVEPDLGEVAAKIALTNSLSDMSASGNFGDAYKGYKWEYETYPVASNNLWEADITISHQVGRNEVATHSTILLYRPQSPVVPVRGSLQ